MITGIEICAGVLALYVALVVIERACVAMDDRQADKIRRAMEGK